MQAAATMDLSRNGGSSPAIAWVSIAMLRELLAALRGEVTQTERERLDAEIEYLIAVAGERTRSL